MAAKRKITINRKKKEPEVKEVEVKEVSLEEALDEIENAVSTVTENNVRDGKQVMFTRTQLRWEIVGKWWSTVVQQPRGRIKFEAQLAAVPMFKLPEDIRRYLTSKWLPTTVWKWDKEQLEKRGVDMGMVEKLKEFLSNMW